MKLIAFFSSFCDGNIQPEIIIRVHQLINSKRYNRDYKFVKNTDYYTHAIILNTAMPKLNISKENVIGLAFEPIQYLGLTDKFIKYAKDNIGKYYISDYNEKLGKPFIEHYSYMHFWYPLIDIKEKTKIMSIMVSDKKSAPGHKYRHIIVNNILRTNLPIDIWGRGSLLYKNDNRIKGIFENSEPYYDYKFHICIENFQTNHYFSEKISSPLMHKTIPIYWGCKNINNYFPNNIINLSGNINNDMKLLIDIIVNPDKYQKNIDIAEIKKTLSIENII
jgi:hypothetical protein